MPHDCIRNGDTVKEKSNTIREIWKEDEELNQLLLRRSGINRNSAEHKEVTKLIKKRVRLLKKMKMADIAREIDKFATRKQIEELYRTFQSDSSTFKNVS